MSSKDTLAERRLIPMQCRVSQAESDRIREAIKQSGERPVAWCRAALLTAAEAALDPASKGEAPARLPAKKKGKR